MAYVNLVAVMTKGWFYTFEPSFTNPALDRTGMATAYTNMLKADTSVLYGASNLLQIIEGNPVLYSKAKVDAKRNRYALYVWAEPEESVEIRSQNADEVFTLNMRFEGLNINTQAGIAHIEDAYERVKYLTNDQMYQGLNLTGYYTDTTAQVIDISPTVSSLSPPEEIREKHIVIEVEGALQITINRWK